MANGITSSASVSASATLVAIMLLLVSCILAKTQVHALSEGDRLEEYKARGYEWPLPHLVPDTPGWKTIFQRRFQQIEETIDGSTERYNAWMQSISSSFVQPNFTENGWGLTRAPEDLVQALVQKLHDGLESAPLEHNVDVIEGGESSRPLFIQNDELNKRALEQLKPMHEEWSKTELVGETAYGLRVYRNDSRLLMHVDKARTHIISCILHVDHSEDSEPWPIVIEDYQGNTNEVVLESGDMLFYESSKCFHGRPYRFKGSWYSSLFVHFYPVGWDVDQKMSEVHYAVPPHWSKNPPEETDQDKLVMVGTSMKEPNCENVWCSLKNSVKWKGPAIDGVVISAGWKPEDEETNEETNDEL